MKHLIATSIVLALLCIGCGPEAEHLAETTAVEQKETFQFQVDKFADLRILRYQVPGFEELSPKQKELLYYLYEAALAGRDLTWAQNYKYNLLVRHTLEGIMAHYSGDREAENFAAFTVYTKRVWFSGGIHHHYANDKMMPGFPESYFGDLVSNSPAASFPLKEGQSTDEFIAELTPILFDPNLDAKKVSLDANKDLLVNSATNHYDDVTEAEAKAFYDKLKDPNNKHPISFGLNSQLAKVDGKLVERVMKVGGLYSQCMERLVYWMEKAASVAENEQQKLALDYLADYFKTGDLATFDKYSIAWVKDTDSRIDVVNGFIESYGDPLSYRGSFESVVSIKDIEATERITAIAEQAQWFEDNSSIMDEHKKKEVVGINAKVITVVMESGDASPAGPIGINLPNANWIRAEHGSKSVNLGNMVRAANMASASSGMLAEFAASPGEIDRAKKYGGLVGDLETDMHEVIGHASGLINPGIGTPKETLKSFASTLEEARADLVALYFLLDPKLVEIGVMDNVECGKAGYDIFIRNGLVQQLRRIKLGDDLEEAHMRNRQLIAGWVFEKGKADNVIERVKREGKTFFIIRDYDKLRVLFGQLLREIQRIKSEGDYKSAKKLVETYGVKIDQELHAEVLVRFAKLNVAAYSGYINPVLTPVKEGEAIVDVKISFPDNFVEQMMFYGKNYSLLPPRL